MIVREAKPQDAGRISRVRVDTWRTTYAGIVPDAYLNDLSYEEKERFFKQLIEEKNESFFIAEKAPGDIIGFASCGPERDGDPIYKGEMYAICVLQAYQHRGVGRQLTEAVVDRLMHNGFSSMLVWVLADNKYHRFYERLGGQKVASRKYDIGGISLDLVAYGWPDIAKITGSDK